MDELGTVSGWGGGCMEWNKERLNGRACMLALFDHCARVSCEVREKLIYLYICSRYGSFREIGSMGWPIRSAVPCSG
jgi:hypothetical protein